MGAFVYLIPDVLVAGRVLSLVLGIASLYWVWKLARILYGERAAGLSLAVFALYSLHVGYSTTSSSEVPCVFFVLSGLFFFFYHFHRGTNRLWHLAISGAALSIAGSIRYEAWIVVGSLLVALALLWIQDARRRERMKSVIASLVTFGALGGAWPAVMMTYCWRKFGDPLYLLTATHTRMALVLATAKPVTYHLALIPSVLFISLSPLAFVAAIYGIVRSRRDPIPAAFAGVTIFLLPRERRRYAQSGRRPDLHRHG